MDTFRGLALEVTDVDRAAGFYRDRLGLSVETTQLADEGTADTHGWDAPAAATVAIGSATLTLRRPTGYPRGGVHTHYALSVPGAAFGAWRDRLAGLNPTEYALGDGLRSLYVDDPDGHCVEFAATGTGGSDPVVTGAFEVAIEVRDLDRSAAFYRDLGFTEIDRGDDRVRVRGPIDLELWRPRLGIADGRAGVHVDLAFGDADPAARVDPVRDAARRVRGAGDGTVVVDPDGHHLSIDPA
ncbi:fosmidomycin resistance protein [Halobacteriales archaeon SW_7_68_16]|nr:MAG: fosmidomycin resistance protein [Halobacteriales archaeon SW_7_68_16]